MKIKRSLLCLWSLLFLSACIANETMSPDVLLESKLLQNSGEVIYIDFWASWCKPCRQSFPWMNTVLENYKAQGLKVITVNLDKSRQLAQQFLKENPADFDIIYDPEGVIAKQFKLKGMPMSFIMSRDGKVASTHVGFNDKKKTEYEHKIIALLKQKRSFRD